MTDKEIEEKLDRVINKVREALKDYYTEFHISVSIGAASIKPDINSFEDLYKLADEKLYEAKHSGKDSYQV